MTKRSPAIPPTAPATLDPNVLHATVVGTARFRSRFASQFAADFYRTAANDLTLSSIGLGTYLGESTDEDDAAYFAAIRRAITSGVNLIDTAINYRSQRSEQTVGTAIQQVIAAGEATRDELVICSKAGYIPLDRTPPATREAYQRYVKREFIDQQILHPDDIVGGGHSLAPRFLRYCLAKSRQNLGLRTIDIYYVHNPGQVLGTLPEAEGRARLKAAFAMLEEAASRGEIGAYGCATWDELRVGPDQKGHLNLEDAVGLAYELAGDAHRFRAIQLPINLAMTEAVRVPTQRMGDQLVTTLQAAANLGLTVVASASLAQGKLTKGLPEALKSHFPALETDAQRALAFVRTIPGVTAALAGMKDPAHVDENLGAGRGTPTD